MVRSASRNAATPGFLLRIGRKGGALQAAVVGHGYQQMQMPQPGPRQQAGTERGG